MSAPIDVPQNLQIMVPHVEKVEQPKESAANNSANQFENLHTKLGQKHHDQYIKKDKKQKEKDQGNAQQQQQSDSDEQQLDDNNANDSGYSKNSNTEISLGKKLDVSI